MSVSAQSAALRSVGNYDLLEKIADGGIGAVYKGRNRTTGEIVAVKVLQEHLLQGHEVLRKRFEREFHAARELDHPHLVRALDFGQEGAVPYLVLEFVDGESLGARIERDGPLAEDEAVRLIVQAAEALEEVHAYGMIHRDVKPDNILLTADGQAKLTDLGLLKELDTEQNLTRTHGGLGTPNFMAPEQFRSAKHVDCRCDIYALAATLYMAVTGELPFGGCNLPEVWMRKQSNDLPRPGERVAGLSTRVDQAICRAMSADPNQRPASCRAFVEELTGRSAEGQADAAAEPTDGFWLLRYTDASGMSQTANGTLEAMRRFVQDALLGNGRNIRASRSEAGPFKPLRAHAVFRDLVLPPPLISVPEPVAGDTRSGLIKPPLLPPTPQPMATPRPTPERVQGPTVHIAADGSRDDLDWLTAATAIFLAAGVFLAWLWFFAR